jgi:hypothetical protein
MECELKFAFRQANRYFASESRFLPLANGRRRSALVTRLASVPE